jgi:hypothetical protein
VGMGWWEWVCVDLWVCGSVDLRMVERGAVKRGSV